MTEEELEEFKVDNEVRSSVNRILDIVEENPYLKEAEGSGYDRIVIEIPSRKNELISTLRRVNSVVRILNELEEESEVGGSS